MSKEVVAIVPECYPGVLEWFRHGNEVGLWDLVVVGEGPVALRDDADVYLFGAWHPAYEDVVKALKAAGKYVAVGWSSSPGEMDLAPVEFEHLVRLLRGDLKPIVDEVLCLHAGLAEALGVGHLPAPVAVPDVRALPSCGDIGLFAPETAKKNAFAQVMAAKIVQREWHAALRTNMAGHARLARSLGVNTILEPWLPRNEHLARLGRLEVALAAGFAESWCYGAVDALSQGVPVVHGPSMGWLPQCWRVEDVNDPARVAQAIDAALAGRDYVDPRGILERVAVRQNEAASVAVKRLLDRAAAGR